MGDLISLSEKTNDATLRPPMQALEEAIKHCQEGGLLEGRRKILILSLDDANGEYKVNFIQSGMNMSQCLTVCEVAKAVFLAEMNYT